MLTSNRKKSNKLFFYKKYEKNKNGLNSENQVLHIYEVTSKLQNNQKLKKEKY